MTFGLTQNHESAIVPSYFSPTNARMIILSSILGTLLFIIGYFLIIEILDVPSGTRVRTRTHHRKYCYRGLSQRQRPTIQKV